MMSLLSRTIRKIALIPIAIHPILLLIGCSRMEQTEREKIRRQNCAQELIYRSHTDHLFATAAPAHTPRSPYPWEAENHLPRLTKDFFRCKGSPIHPSIADESDPTHLLSDCDGWSRHGFPLVHGKEGVYPILVDLLNYVQKKTGRRVVITCGHRCPAHNTYADPSKSARTSRHQIGAEVDFYVQGMEERPEEIVSLLIQYFKETPTFRTEKDSQEFRRGASSELSVPAWTNRDISIQLFQKHEGRDGDNRHPHPYLSIQVLYDRQKQERVVYDWQKAHQGLVRS